jgi:hypothetical protein
LFITTGHATNVHQSVWLISELICMSAWPASSYFFVMNCCIC